MIEAVETMSSFLERYQLGECEVVWDELMSLGKAVRKGPVLPDALAVARETMRRVLYNLETLIPRLRHLGYEFGYGWIQPSSAQSFSWEQRQQYLEMMEWAAKQTPILSVATDLQKKLASDIERLEYLRQIGASPLLIEKSQHYFAELEAQRHRDIDELEKASDVLPLSVYAWYESIGSVNFTGQHVRWLRYVTDEETTVRTTEQIYDQQGSVHPFHRLEPLRVYPLQGKRLRDYRTLVTGGEGRSPTSLPLIPNAFGTYAQMSQDAFDYEIVIPSAAVDAPLLYETHHTTFVSYLRNCLRWGGFPGWEQIPFRPDEDIAFLTRDLLPI